MTRVLVIGGGFAGATAALAAREAGAEVTLAAGSAGATALCGGLVEVAADPLGRALPPLDAANELARRDPGHPFARLRESLPSLPAALEFVRRRFAPLFGAEGPGLFATVLGGVRAAAFAQAAQAAGALAAGKRVAVAWFPRQPALLDGPGVAAALSRAGFEARACALDWLDREGRLALTAFDLARLLDREGEATSLGESIARARPEADVLLLPPCIGLEQGDGALALLSARGGVRCAELVASTPSVPGVRLQRQLESALQRAGVGYARAAVAALREGSAELSQGGGARTVAFDQAVLASGRFIGGGVRRDPIFREPLLGLPIWDGAERLGEQPIDRLLGEGPGAPAPAFRAGLRVDVSLRPLDAEGRPLGWLRAAGAVIGGGDAAVDGAGLGLAAFTGWWAGRLAAGVEG